VIRPVFDVVFKAYALYFFDNQLKQLVPDVRWFPSRASTSTRLVSALLGGPSDWLSTAVKSAIPAGTKLSLSTVTVADGIATVDLSSKALEASAAERRMMQVQIRETLIQLNSVYSVNVTVQRSALEANSWTFPNVQNQIVTPVALYENELVHLDSDGSNPIGGSKALLSD
jgi:spore germination protein GerM